MGRARKDGDPLQLAGTRLAFRRGRFYYVHRDTGRWENVGTDVAAAKQIAARYNNPGDGFGTLSYWFGMFLADCKLRVAAKTFSQRTLDDYTGYAADDGPLVAAFGKRLPQHIEPVMVQAYLDANASMDPPRPVPANREKAFLSSCISWLIRTGKVPGLVVNPCMRASGVQRNPESKRERYVTHAEYRAVYDAGNRAVRLAMELVYRTLQRPEVDVLAWTPSNVRTKDGGKVLHFRQSKTGRLLDIALVGELGALVAEAIGEVPQLRQPILHRLDGKAYTYDGLSSMLKQAQDKVRARHAKEKGPLAAMPSFALRDLKGKGATDMWLAGTLIEQIQLLCGHADKTTTERYIKARWRMTAQPNLTTIYA
ncbi:MAG: integrase [Methylibium sp.]|uniref:integrase n=1 Tax=Methylibium sp. TaxID=2067992 RepID=UPI00182E61B9|nr:integrase [Methylibium sp.]MBA3597509.1 integrase [Methylibium sp.]